MFANSWIAESFASAFESAPPVPIWEWAESNVWIDSKGAAEPGFYRSSKTPWTRRLQDLIKDGCAWFWSEQDQRWVQVLVSEIAIEKSSQSGFTEGILNGIRWRAQYEPCNVLYQINSQKEATNIQDRLESSFKKMPGVDRIFTGTEDDIKGLVMHLRAMTIWLIGSGSSGQAANKQAPLVVCDEVEEHSQEKGDTDTLTNAGSRKKTAAAGLQINLSKPKLKSGPIHKAFLEGNQEEYHVECPHCRSLQWLTFFAEEKDVPFAEELCDVHDIATGEVIARLPKVLPLGEVRTVKTGRLVFEHCKNRLGHWDKMRLRAETYYECASCMTHVEKFEALKKAGHEAEAEEYLAAHRASIEHRGRIDEWRKAELVAAGQWLPTAHGSPGIVSQHISDLYSSDADSSWGNIVLKFLRATRKGRTTLQGFYNHILGLAFADEASETTSRDIVSNIAGRTAGDACPAYRRGIIPFRPRAIILGGDVGGNYAKWALGAVPMRGDDIAIFDWGSEIDPSEITDIIRARRWECPDMGKKLAITIGFLDGKYRKTDVYRACLGLPHGLLIPTAGFGTSGSRGVRVWSFHQLPTYPRGFCQLTYNDADASDELYIDRLKKKNRRVWFPQDVEQDAVFVEEMCATVKKPDKDGVMKWDRTGDNHWGDAVKDVVTGFRFLTRADRKEVTSSEPPAEQEPERAAA